MSENGAKRAINHVLDEGLLFENVDITVEEFKSAPTLRTIQEMRDYFAMFVPLTESAHFGHILEGIKEQQP
jgi:hypothetical protein